MREPTTDREPPPAAPLADAETYDSGEVETLPDGSISIPILEEELVVSMGLLGVRNIAEITPNHICKVDPVAPAHEMSAWPNLPGGRLL